MTNIDEVVILIVEDGKPTRERLKLLFESPPAHLQALHSLRRFRVIAVESKREALDYLELARLMIVPNVDIVILDLGIPESPAREWAVQIGLEFLPELREAGYPVIVFSDYGTCKNLTYIINAHATAFVAKPIDTLVTDAYAPLIQMVSQVWQQIVEQEWAECRTRRLREWVLRMSCVRLGDRLRIGISRELTRVAGCADTLGRLASTPSAIAESLNICRRELNEAIGGTTRATREAIAMSLDLHEWCPDDEVIPEVGQLVHAKVSELRAGILARKLTVCLPSKSGPAVRLPARPLALLIEVLVFQAISQAPFAGHLEVSVRSEGQNAVLGFVLPVELATRAQSVLEGYEEFDFLDETAWNFALIRRLVAILAGSAMVDSTSGNAVLCITLPGDLDASDIDS